MRKGSPLAPCHLGLWLHCAGPACAVQVADLNLSRILPDETHSNRSSMSVMNPVGALRLQPSFQMHLCKLQLQVASLKANPSLKYVCLPPACSAGLRQRSCRATVPRQPQVCTAGLL